MSGLIFDEKTMLNSNIFKYEQRLQSHMNKYIGSGAILTTYFSQNENATTVDRGLQTADQLFGKKSPFRFNQGMQQSCLKRLFQNRGIYLSSTI